MRRRDLGFIVVFSSLIFPAGVFCPRTAASLEPAVDVPRFTADLDVDFAGRQRDKTVVRVLVLVAPGSLPPAQRQGVNPASDAREEHEFLLAGRVSRGGQPFESFLYRFHGRPPGDAAGHPIPLSFERFLPPGDFTLAVKLEHVPSRSVFVEQREITVPELVTAAAPGLGAAVPAIS